MSGYEITVMVPVRVRVEDAKSVDDAFRYAEPKLAKWSKESSGGSPTGFSVVLIASEKL